MSLFPHHVYATLHAIGAGLLAVQSFIIFLSLLTVGSIVCIETVYGLHLSRPNLNRATKDGPDFSFQ